MEDESELLAHCGDDDADDVGGELTWRLTSRRILVLRNAALIAGMRNNLMLRAAVAGERAGQRQWR